MSYQPSAPQVGGTITAALSGMFSDVFARIIGLNIHFKFSNVLGVKLTVPVEQIVITALIGGTIGFFVTTFWKLLFDWTKEKINQRREKKNS